MDDENAKTIDEDQVKQKKKADEDQTHCTAAPSAEQARASADDDPCDDSRG